MKSTKTNLKPFTLLAVIFFLVGFMTTVNGQCQGPLKVSFLANAGELRNTLATMISFFFFLGYLASGNKGGKWINRHGYKTTLSRGLLVMVTGLFVYFLASLFADNFRELVLSIGKDNIPYGFLIFLLGSFLMGSSAALLQTVIIPYASACDLPGTQSVQRVNIVCAVNSFGTTIAPFFVTGVLFSGVSLDYIEASQLKVPFIIMTLCVILIWLVVNRQPLADIKQTRIQQGEVAERSIWSFRHLRLGVVAIFFYVGVEVAVGTNVNLHAIELANAGNGLSFLGKQHFILLGLDLGIPALLATLYWTGMMIGRIVSGFFNRISERILLSVVTTIAIILISIAILTNNLWMLVSVGLFHSVMWGCIFTLAVKGLKKYTSQASGVFMTGVFGGAMIPILQGVLADVLGSWQWTWLIVIVCELVILYYALYGCKIRKEELDF